MKRKLLRTTIVDSDVLYQRRIKFSISVGYWRKKEYYDTAHQLFRDLKKTYTSVSREVLCSILIEFGMPRRLVGLIKMCLNETYSTVRIGKYQSDMFPTQKGVKKRDVWRRRFENGIKMDLKEIRPVCVEWINLAQGRDCLRFLVNAVLSGSCATELCYWM
jgi:hypothetical protein